MRTILITLLLAVSASQAYAIGKYNISGMTCGQVQAIIAREHAAILRYPSRRNPGLTLYDRYVSNGSYCATEEYAKYTTVPTRDDKTCPVYYCRDYSISE